MKDWSGNDDHPTLRGLMREDFHTDRWTNVVLSSVGTVAVVASRGIAS
jgi:hypothetical protein